MYAGSANTRRFCSHMARRRARGLVAVAVVISAVALGLAFVAGVLAAPDRELVDRRRSTLRHGPHGASGLVEALEVLDVPVERRRRALFGLAADTVPVEPDAWLVLLDFTPFAVDERVGPIRTGARRPSDVEVREVARYLARGGAAFLGGETGIARCFGLRLVPVHDRWDDEGALLAVPSPADLGPLPGTHAVLAPDTAPGARRRNPFADEEPCEGPEIRSQRALLVTRDGDPVAVRLEFTAGGRAIVLAESRYVANRTMRETDAGVLVLSWLLTERPRRIIVDEYHQGFGKGGSIFAAAWRWARGSPAGWAILQLAVAGCATLAVAMVRFGPALRVIERRRRSPMEHLEALAIGLERAEGTGVAVRRIIAGLQRRLGRAGALRRRGGEIEPWLDSLARATDDPRARRAVERLRRLLHEPGGHDAVVEAALAVEDVWQALRPTKTRDGFSPR